jgi:hypothetical protein
MNDRYKMIAGFLLVAAIALGGSLAIPRPALAQGGVVSVENIIFNNAAAISKAESEAKQNSLNSIDYAITSAMLTAVNTAAQRVAQTTATWLASGNLAQGPMIFSKEFGAYGTGLFLDTFSDALNNFAKNTLGFGICQPLNASVSLRIKLGIARVNIPQPSCSWNKFKAAVGGTMNNIESGKLLQNVTASFEMGQSPLSFALNTQFTVANQAKTNQANGLAQRLSSNGFKDLVSPISGNVKTPAAMIQNASDMQYTAINNGKDIQMTQTINHSQLLAEVGANALRVFTSTIVSDFISKYLKNGVVSLADVVCKTPVGSAFDLCRGAVNEQLAAGSPEGSTGVELADAYFASIFTPTANVIDDYSPIDDLSSCPTPVARGVWNCVMDQGFVSALTPGDGGYLSVSDAVTQGLLNGSWDLIPPTDSRNNDPNCYTQGFCYTNLVKLRRMRIIPVGWEMAAAAGPITLSDALAKFNDCNANGQLDSDHPFCHLVDPDWILKVPVTQCKAQVYGQTLEAPNTPDRAEVCVNAPSCISEDANGKCTGGFGYCTREHNVWTIDATACPSQFASCDTFSDPNGKQLSVLRNTVDESTCTAQNAGCRPYNLVGNATGGWADGQSSIFLNSQAADCDATAAGCRALNEISSATTANLIPNPSFETPTADGSTAQGWGNLGDQYVQDGFNSFDGIAAMHIVAGATLQLGGYYGTSTQPPNYAEVQVQPKSLYTLSFYAKGNAAAGTGSLTIKAFDTSFYGTPHLCTGLTTAAGQTSGQFPTCLQNMNGDIGYQPTCTTTAATGTVTCALVGVAGLYEYGYNVPYSGYDMSFPLSAGYERYTLTFATSSNTGYLGFTWGGGDYFIDAVQLEAGATATAFHVGGSDSAGTVVDIKAPPAYLNCTGEDSDPAACASYAQVCRQSEVGCDDYTPSDGGTNITAVTSSNDVCPAECLGYSTFKQEPTLWNSAQFPLYFIPSTAHACNMTQVGCDEFTDLSAAATGGESKAYFTYIRACRQPDPASDGNYFTWEGSDTSGYQLESYVLVNKDSGDGTMLAVANTAENFVQTTSPNPESNPPGPVYLAGTDPAGCTQDIYQGTNGAVQNPDCREFINAEGDIFYRLLSKTITATADCKTYRKTLSSQADCAGSGGIWNTAASACDYFTYPAQSTTCPASVSGCRAYTGNEGNNVQILFTSDFENNDADNWTGGTFSDESTVVGEHSYAVAATAAVRTLVDASGNPIMHQDRSYVLTLWAKGTGDLSAYLAGKNIQPANAADRSMYFADPTNTTTAIALTTEWQRYELGPVIMNWVPDAGDTLHLGTSSGTVYVDNIELTETQEQFALVAGSWITPPVCDETSAGQALPQAQLNCAAYSNKAGNTVDLKSFDHLCRAEAVGCEAFTDTQGTTTPFSSFRNAVCSIAGAATNNSRDCQFDGQTVCSVAPGATSCRFDFDGGENQLGTSGIYTVSKADDTLEIPPDTTDYLVNNDKFTCDATDVGCTALGDNDLNTIGTCNLGAAASAVTPCTVAGSSDIKCYVYTGQSSCSYRIPWTTNGSTVYKTIVPDDLTGQLCTEDAVSCNEWTVANGSTYEFKDPGSALCEYKDSGTLNNNPVSGWFKKGSAEPCDATFIVGGTSLGIRKNLDPEFAPNAFAGTCDDTYAGCTEFTDHADPGEIYSPTTAGTSCQYTVNSATCGASWCQTDPATGNATSKPCTVEFGSGRPFYYINDSKITDATAACNNQVSQKEGCLLLDQTDNPQKLWDTTATYKDSNKQGFILIAPDSNPGDSTTTPPTPSTNDANIIIKVKRDRVCSEWLECNTDQTTTDPTTGRDTTRCLGLGSCIAKGADGLCQTWGQLDDTNENAKLDPVLYSSRDVTSAGNDYSGFSIPNQYPVGSMKQSPVTPGGPIALFVNGNEVQDETSAVTQSCEIYPESDAPFPKTVLADPTGPVTGSRQTGFNNVNVCEYQKGDILSNGKDTFSDDCECSYRKAVYGSDNKYFPPTAEAGVKYDGSAGEIKAAICSGGPYDGEECWPFAAGTRNEPNNLSCDNGNDSGECTPLTKIDSLVGEQGYCLEHDDTLRLNASNDPTDTACITWLPIDAAQGHDTANQFLSAAFMPKIGEERYCAAPAKYCEPHDCANPPEVNPLCTQLKNTPIVYNGESGYPGVSAGGDATHSANCFDSCNAGSDSGNGLNTACESAENLCGSYVQTYCYDYDYNDAATLWGDGTSGDIATYCTGKVQNIHDDPLNSSSSSSCANYGEYVSNVDGSSCTPNSTNATTCILATTGQYCQNMFNSCQTYETALQACNTAGGTTTTIQNCKIKSYPTDIVANAYCTEKTQYDPSCNTFDATSSSSSQYCQDIYQSCLSHATNVLTFCKNMDTLSCFSGYGSDAQCSHDVPGEYLGNSFAYYPQYPLYNASAFCGVTGYGAAGQSTVQDLTKCATSGTQFCGNGEACAPGTECTSMDDLSVHQTEYTAQEATEGYCIDPTGGAITNYLCPLQDATHPLNLIDYSTMPSLGSHTFFGSSASGSSSHSSEWYPPNPLLSANVLELKVSEADGDWINVFNTGKTSSVGVAPSCTPTPDPKNAGLLVYPNGCQISDNAQNVCPETAPSAPVIGSYPIDFLGLYYFGTPGSSGSASASYDLVSPPLLLASQIDRITVKVLSNGNDGLCQYGVNAGTTPSIGRCWSSFESSGNTNLKGLFPTYGANYGYSPSNTNNEDDENFTPDGSPSYVVLSDSNNWTYQLSSDEGSTTITALMSDNSPKRLIGMKVDLSDNNNRGYIYISALDVHLRGPVCGAATYVGSSNPTAESKYLPVAYTNMVNSSEDFTSSFIANATAGVRLGDSPPSGEILQTTSCTPWGAISASDPPSFATDSQSPPASNQCEINKGGIAADIGEQQKIFAKAVGVNLFDSATGAFDLPPDRSDSSFKVWSVPTTNVPAPVITAATCDDSGCTPAAGATSQVSINNLSSGHVDGAGSLRANLKFYAVADSNHMPIRSVKVNWGDGTDGVDPGIGNSYKNHDGGSVTVNGVSVADCSNNNLSFTQTSNACDPKPFAYSHVYSCNEDTPAIYKSSAANDYPDIGVKTGDTICTFVPQVTIIDNWNAQTVTNLTTTVQVVVAPAAQ